MSEICGMNREMLKKTFREYKKAAGVDFALTNTGGEFPAKYCGDYKGICVTHTKRDYVYVSHDLTDEQAAIFYKVFGQNYNIYPKEYNPYKCFQLYEKDEHVYEVFQMYEDGATDYHPPVVGEDEAMTRIKEIMRYLEEDRYKAIKGIQINRVF